jgi:hypothetical protein
MDLINEYPDLMDADALVADALECVPDDLLSTEISMPEFPQKININHDEELPSLDELPKEVEVEVEVESDDYPTLATVYNKESLEQIMDDIESAVNFDSFDASMYALNNPEFLMNRIQDAFNNFKEKVGRNMTYSEMRHMMG